MTTKELSEHILKTGVMDYDGLTVTVVILDAKVSYGRARYQVRATPAGAAVWVDAARVQFEREGKE